MLTYILFLIIITTLFFYIYKFYYTYVEFYSQILYKRKIPDYTRWILSDKFIAKKYAHLNGFEIPKTYQIVKYPQEINFEKLKNINFVIKPCDLCDSKGVYLIKNNIDIKKKRKFDKNIVIKELLEIRSKIFSEYYMHDKMYDGLVPFTGYIVEELLLDDDKIPHDYKCYVFNKKIHFIVVTYNRKIINGEQIFNSTWFDRDWNPIKIKMIKKGYLYKKIPKPKNYKKILNLVENIAKKLDRHCRIDIYSIKDKIYFGEFTFFTGALLHTFYCNMILGYLWLKYADNYAYDDKLLKEIVPSYYNKIN